MQYIFKNRRVDITHYSQNVTTNVSLPFKSSKLGVTRNPSSYNVSTISHNSVFGNKKCELELFVHLTQGEIVYLDDHPCIILTFSAHALRKGYGSCEPGLNVNLDSPDNNFYNLVLTVVTLDGSIL